jgi:hypothetical protein
MTLTIAVLLQWIAAIVAIIGAVGVIVSEFSVVGLIVSLILIAIAVIRAIIALSLARGHNWARILISVFAIVSAFGAVSQIFSGSVLGGIVGLVIEILVLWLMWNSSSSTYIKVKTAERAVTKDIRG